jgi:hypothetical protein
MHSQTIIEQAAQPGTKAHHVDQLQPLQSDNKQPHHELAGAFVVHYRLSFG